MKFAEFYYLTEKKKSEFQVLKDNKIDLTSEERKEAMDAKCVWHHGPNESESCAIWKGKDSSGKIWFVSNTHRAFRKSPTLKSAIKEYQWVKTTS